VSRHSPAQFRPEFLNRASMRLIRFPALFGGGIYSASLRCSWLETKPRPVWPNSSWELQVEEAVVDRLAPRRYRTGVRSAAAAATVLRRQDSRTPWPPDWLEDHCPRGLGG